MPTTRPILQPPHGQLLPSIAALPLSAAIRDTLTDLFGALGADADFVGYPSLARVIRDGLDTGDRIALPAPGLRAPYLDAVQHLLALQPNPLVDIPRGASPPGPPSRYPIIRGLLADAVPAYIEQAMRLRSLLVFAALLHRHAEVPPAVGSAATEIRLAFRAGDVRRDLLAGLPELSADRLSLGELAWSCESLRGRGDLAPQQRDFLRALSNLAHLCISASKAAERRALLELRTPLVGIDELPDGSLAQVSEPVDDHYRTAKDPPDETCWIFRERPKKDPVSVRGFAAKTRRSRFWVTAATRALPWDRSVVSPTQLDTVLTSLRVKTKSPEDAPERWSGALLAVVLATGLDLEEVAALELGEGKQLDAAAGLYRRFPPANSEGSEPNPEPLEWQLARGGVLELPLPDPVCALLPATVCGPIGDWLNSWTPLWPDAFADYLSALRDVEALRITPRRVGNLIAHRLQQLYGDPAITYLLVGLKRQAIPMDLYYAAIPANRLIEAYRQAVTGIFFPGS